MKCDLHVHTKHSGRCTLPLLRRHFRESYSEPGEVYAQLKRRGMDLVTITDHDSIEAAAALQRHPDFFLSEEVTVIMPSGTEIHLGVYDITEHQHHQIQQRRRDLPALLAYLSEKRIFHSVNHIFSCLTGRRDLSDFQCLEEWFTALETQNGLIPEHANRAAARLARNLGKLEIGGSDAHVTASAARVFTQVPGARNKREFLDGLRCGRARVVGSSGGFLRLTLDVFSIAAAATRAHPWALCLAPLAAAIPLCTSVQALREHLFTRHWLVRLERAGLLDPAPGLCATPALKQGASA
jgi:predicted metal-dependent phosphoesterase TrpH